MCSKGGPEVSAMCVSTSDSADTSDSFLARCDLTGVFLLTLYFKQCQCFFFVCSFVIELAVVFFTALQLPAMAYRVNGLPPFQVSFSITFPEGYVGKEKMDTKFHVDAEDSQVQAREGCKSAIF